MRFKPPADEMLWTWFKFWAALIVFLVVAILSVRTAFAQDAGMRCTVSCTVDLERNICSYDPEPVNGICVPCVDNEKTSCEPRMKRI